MFMRRNIQSIVTILLLWTVTNDLSARQLRIVVEDVIGSSKFAGEVVIIGYDGKGQMSFKSTEYRDTISVAKIGRQLDNGYDFPYKPTDNYWTENYPHIGDTVFIVVNEHDLIRIFGKRVQNDYRLWSPLMTGSIAIFDYSAPLKSIDSSMVLGNNGKTESCWDGCLIPINLTRSIVAEYIQKFKNKLNSIQLQAFVGQTVQTVFYNDTLRLFHNLIWIDEPPGKLRGMLLTYATEQAIEIIPDNHKNEPIQFDINRNFNLDEFKKLTIKEIRWTD
jgi:hypothetical protein